MTLNEVWNYTTNCKWGTVIISDKNGKPFKIKDDNLVFEMIMKSDGALVGINGNNTLLNKLILEADGYPSYRKDNYLEFAKKWNDEWQHKSHILDVEIFEVCLFSSCYTDAPMSFINPKTHKVGLAHNVRWTYDKIGACKEELEWVCKNFCKDGIEFYVTFFDDECDWYEAYKKAEEPKFTLKLTSEGISVVNTIPKNKLNKIVKSKYNKKIYGKEYKRINRFYRIKKLYRKLQNIFFNDDYIIWHNYVLLGNTLDNIVDMHERYYSVNEELRMIDMWKDYIREEE